MPLRLKFLLFILASTSLSVLFPESQPDREYIVFCFQQSQPGREYIDLNLFRKFKIISMQSTERKTKMFMSTAS